MSSHLLSEVFPYLKVEAKKNEKVTVRRSTMQKKSVNKGLFADRRLRLYGRSAPGQTVTFQRKEHEKMAKQNYRNAIGQNMKKRFYGLDDTVTTVAFKFYAEQMPKGEEALQEVIRSFDPTCVQALMIKHDRDTVAESFWETAKEKPHYHLIMRLLGKNGRKLRTIMKMMKGTLVYRKGLDDDLLTNHGCEPCKNFAAYATYLTHDTDQAIQDGKHRYPLDAIVSNLTEEEVKQIRDGYVRVSNTTHRISMSEWIEMDEDAYKRGYALQDWDEWERQQPFVIRSNAKLKTIKKRYLQGVEDKINEDDYLTRLCLFIHSDKPNLGKTYNSTVALKKLGVKKILAVAGGGTGKLDNLTINHDAILCDDDTLPQLLNLADNKITSPYRRNSDNPHWCGRWLIVTSNLSINDWINKCGVTDKKQTEAVMSRFYVCDIREQIDKWIDYETGEEKVESKMVLHLEQPSTRGDLDAQEKRKEMYWRFKGFFEESLNAYIPKADRYDDLSDEDYDFDFWRDGADMPYLVECLDVERRWHLLDEEAYRLDARTAGRKLDQPIRHHHRFESRSIPNINRNEMGRMIRDQSQDWDFCDKTQIIMPLKLDAKRTKNEE